MTLFYLSMPDTLYLKKDYELTWIILSHLTDCVIFILLISLEPSVIVIHSNLFLAQISRSSCDPRIQLQLAFHEKHFVDNR